jgi:hypothetical protein
MKLSAFSLAAAVAVAFALIWTLCSVAVLIFPSAMAMMTEHMIHADLTGFHWTLTWGGYLMGLISWVVWAGVTGWLAATVYNRIAADG